MIHVMTDLWSLMSREFISADEYLTVYSQFLGRTGVLNYTTRSRKAPLLPCAMKEKMMNSIVSKKLSITALLTATRLGREEDIRNSLTKHGLPKNGAKTTDYVVLQAAAKKDHKNIVQILLDAGCRVNPTANDKGLTPLTHAIKNENEEIAMLLLNKGANLNSGDLTVFHIAAQQQSLEMLHFLLQYDVDVNCVRNNQTAFQMFFNSSHPYSQLEYKDSVEIFKLFLLNGASLHINHDWTVLHFVTTTAHTDIIKMVLQATTDVNRCTDKGNTSLHHLLQVERIQENDLVDIVQVFVQKGAKVDILNNDGLSACHLVANKKLLIVLQILITCYWNVNHCDAESNTTLHLLLENSLSFVMSPVYYQVVSDILSMESFKFVRNNLGKFPIHIAIENNQRQIVNDMLLKPDIDVNSRDVRFDNYTILHLYLKKIADNTSGHPDDFDIEIVRKLISMGARADIINDEEKKVTPMHFACLLMNKTIMQLLLNNFNFQQFVLEQRKSILHFLIHNINPSSEAQDSQEIEALEIAELCIRKGANVNLKDEYLRTLLPTAVLRRQKHMVKILLENGAAVDDSVGKIILNNLMEHSYVQLVYYSSSESPYDLKMEIIEVGGDIPKDTEILELLASKRMSLDNKSSKGFTVFHYAASKKYTDMLAKLLPYIKNANVRDPYENTVLHTILNTYTNEDHEGEKKLLGIVSALISKRALVTTVNDRGEMPLHLAVKNKHLEILKILLQHGADLKALDNNGNSVLHYLSMLNVETKTNIEADLITLCIGHGCNINAKNSEGITPLLMAAQSGCSTITRLLLQHGARLDCTVDEDASTLLHVAAALNHSGVIEELIKFGADVNATRKDGATPLHFSVSHEVSDITRMLLLNGADTEMKDNNRRTALHWACWYNRSKNVDQLLVNGADVGAEDNFGVLPLLLTQRSTDCWRKIYFHAMKLKAANILNSRSLEKYIEQYEQMHLTDPTIPIANEYFNIATEEVLKMKETIIDVDLNLTDVLHMSPRHLCRLNNNQIFQELSFSPEFDQQFSLYGDLIRACYRKNIVRSGLITVAKDVFGRMIGFNLEDSCCEKIFHDLSDQDLRQLDKASKIKTIKRKMVVEDTNAVDHPEKRRRASF